MNLTEDAAGHMVHPYFGWLDFTVFGLMLGFSAIIGIYFGFCDKKQESRADYLFGGKAMSTLPVAVSLVASHFSGITLIGVPAEVFYYGTVYWLVNVSSVIVAVIVNYIYLPVFYSLQLTSSYECPYMRENKVVRKNAVKKWSIAPHMPDLVQDRSKWRVPRTGNLPPGKDCTVPIN